MTSSSVVLKSFAQLAQALDVVGGLSHTVNYTAAEGILTRGIKVQKIEGVSGKGISLGDRKNGGWGRFLLLDRHNGPEVSEEEKVFNASVVALPPKDEKQKLVQHLLINSPANNDGNDGSILVKIESGRKGVTPKWGEPRISPIEGNPKKIDGGTVKKADGQITSQEELWSMKPGDKIRVLFYDRRSFVVQFHKDGKPQLVETTKEEMKVANKATEQKEAEWADALAEKLLNRFDKETMENLFKVNHNKKHVLTAFGETFSDGLMEQLGQGPKNPDEPNRWAPFQVAQMHTLVRVADWAGMTLEVADFLRHLTPHAPHSVLEKLPTIPKERKNFSPERAKREARRNALRAARHAAQPQKGKTGAKPSYKSGEKKR